MAATRRRVDLNLDLGEGFGVWSRDNDEETLLTLATSVNLACGFHAGDPGRMRGTVQAARDCGVAVGAHPGLPDLAGFGRRPLLLAPAEVKDNITYQVGALEAFVRAAGMALHHVKLHGALASQCNGDRAAAMAYVEAIGALSDDVPIYANRNSEVWSAAEQSGVPAIAEFYADVPLRRDGSRVPPESGHGPNPHATPDLVRARVRAFLETGSVDAYDGGRVEVVADSISVHSDGPGAVDLARAVRAGVEDAGSQLSAEILVR